MRAVVSLHYSECFHHLKMGYALVIIILISTEVTLDNNVLLRPFQIEVLLQGTDRPEIFKLGVKNENHVI